MGPYQPKKVDKEILKKKFRIIGNHSHIEVESEPFQQVLSYSHSFRKVKNVLGAVLFLRYGLQAYDKAQEILFLMCNPSLKQIQGAKRQFKVEIGEHGEVFGHTRPCYKDGKCISYKLRLLNGKSPIGKKLVYDSHIHMVTLLKQKALLMRRGIFLLQGNKSLKSLMESCLTCRLLRKQALQAQLGPDSTMIQGKTVWERIHLDLSGPWKIRLTRNIKQKVWILGCSCSFTRFVKLQVIQDMTASSIMTGLKTGSAYMGKNLPREIVSDAAANVNIVRGALDEDLEQMSTKEFQGLHLRLQKEGTKIRKITPYSQWANGKQERLFGLMKKVFKSWNILRKAIPLLDFNFYVSQAEILLNQRPLLLQELGEEQIILTPNDLVYGHQLQEETRSPTSKHPLLDQYEILLTNTTTLRNLWMEAYVGKMRAWSKWKFNNTSDLQEGDLLLLPDRQTNHLGYGILVNKLSPRTLEIQVISKLPQVDRHNKVVKPAVKTIIQRSAHSCVLLGRKIFLLSGIQPAVPEEEPEGGLADQGEGDPTIPEEVPEEGLTEIGEDVPAISEEQVLGDERASEAPETTTARRAPGDEEIPSDNLVEALSPLPLSHPLDEFLGSQD